MSGEATQKSGNQGCILFAAFIGVLVFASSLGNCSGSSPSASENPFGAQSLQDQVAGITPVASVQPLSTPAIAQGAAHFKAVNDAEGLPGAMVYSQNCYDHVSRDFSWASLDICGAFDALAAEAVAEKGSLTINEKRYFGSDASIARYAAVTSHAGVEAEAAENRARDLQTRTTTLVTR